MLRLGGPQGVAVPLRVIVLVLVTLFAFIMTFPSLREYLSQKAQHDAVIAQIEQARATNAALEDELALWDDPAYVKAQARERLSYVMPGETTYVVVDAGSVATSAAQEAQASQEHHDPWYVTLRSTVRVAGEAATATAADPAQQGWTTPTPADGASAEATPTATAASTSPGSEASP